MATVEVNNMTFEKSFISSTRHHKPVPNHLLETKMFSKVSENEVFQACPSSIHFSGFEIKKTSKQTLKLTNISAQCQRMHIIPPTSSYFKIKYLKKERLVPGFFMQISVEFTPRDWRYYHDCIRIHCQSEENLIVPIHAYPALKLPEFPSRINFGAVPVGESEVRTISLKSDIPVDFEFRTSLSQSNPAITVEPEKGVIPGCGALDVKVTFSPTEFCTVHSKLQLLLSQFNASPKICHITGGSAPGLKLKLLGMKDTVEDIEEAKRSTKALDPVTIDPLYRSRLKKMGKSKTSTWVPPSDVKNEELIHNGIRFPKNLSTPSAVSYVLQQQPGRLKAKDIREAVKQKKDVSLSTKQLKETVFEYKVQQDIQEERQNQLRWCVKLGQDAISDHEKNKILDDRTLAENEYRLQRGDPLADVEFDRSCTSCVQRRIHRQANAIPDLTARFDAFVNNNWTKRQRVLRRFVQAGRKVIIRIRAKRHLQCLKKFLSERDQGLFNKENDRTRHTKSVDDNISTPFVIEPEMVSSFSFPVYKPSTDEEDDIQNSLGQLTVESTMVQMEPYIPYFKLKVPQQYAILGYKPHSSQMSAIGHVPKGPARPLRSGAEMSEESQRVRDMIISKTKTIHLERLLDPEDEVINLLSTVPHTKSNAEVLEVSTVDDGGEDPSKGELHVVSESPPLLQDGGEQREDVTTAGKSRLVVPTVFFKQPKYHHLQIFNPSPGLSVLQPPVSYTEVDDDYHLCPLPRYKLMNKSGTNKPAKPFIERPDVISGLMTWKRFSCQTLVSSSSIPNLSDVWVPRWTSPFVDDLLPLETPSLLHDLPEDDEMSDTESHEDDVTDSPHNPAVLSPDMVRAMFPLLSTRTSPEEESEETFPRNGKLPANNNPVSTSGLISRDERQEELSVYVRTYNDRLGELVRQRLHEMNSLLKDDGLKTTL